MLEDGKVKDYEIEYGAMIISLQEDSDNGTRYW